MPPACHVQMPSSNVANVTSFSGSNDNDSAPEDSPQFDHTVWVPKKLVKQWENEHGIRMATIIFWLSSGTTPKDVETAINSSGQKLSIREKWHCDLLDVAEFYELYQQYTQEPIGDTNVRSHAMKQHVRSLVDIKGELYSLYTMDLPFQVDPSTLNVTFPGFESGTLYCHVDVAEKKKKEEAPTFIMRKRSGKGRKTTEPEYSSFTPN
ncbi:hypothetical protein SEMRO_735_G194960.1 [Seminavis robusta]|uniref:Uncharacterized protein n=1 Tax=Seminavis robusta TaxID=568900 RepID=A0A9N8E6S9_9STRA|nr:hypothetical protein SEMRO_735_G194960.1 [Seminavis robusta]|eukprot:Sro735_g194960.1 n/a (208) ;mRNA; f:47832-48455